MLLSTSIIFLIQNSFDLEKKVPNFQNQFSEIHGQKFAKKSKTTICSSAQTTLFHLNLNRNKSNKTLDGVQSVAIGGRHFDLEKFPPEKSPRSFNKLSQEVILVVSSKRQH